MVLDLQSRMHSCRKSMAVLTTFRSTPSWTTRFIPRAARAIGAANQELRISLDFHGVLDVVHRWFCHQERGQVFRSLGAANQGLFDRTSARIGQQCDRWRVQTGRITAFFGVVARWVACRGWEFTSFYPWFAFVVKVFYHRFFVVPRT